MAGGSGQEIAILLQNTITQKKSVWAWTNYDQVFIKRIDDVEDIAVGLDCFWGFKGKNYSSYFYFGGSMRNDLFLYNVKKLAGSRFHLCGIFDNNSTDVVQYVIKNYFNIFYYFLFLLFL